jgi:hypothetical protein
VRSQVADAAIVDKVLSQVPPESQQQLKLLLHKFSELFPVQLPVGLPPTQLPCEAIPLEAGSKASFRRQYRMSPVEHVEIEQQFQLLLDQGLFIAIKLIKFSLWKANTDTVQSGHVKGVSAPRPW